MENSSLNNFINKIGADEKLFGDFLSAVKGGSNSVSHNVVSQAVVLDDSWILTIEGALYSIEQIVRNPRKFIKENELLVDVAKARRTNSKTVRHLASHTQFIQNIDERGDVMPKKLLTAELDEDLSIYENRFICALINRLILFVEQRNRDLDGKLDVFDQTNIRMESNFNYGDSRFKCDFTLSVQEPPEDKAKAKRNQDLYERMQIIRRRLRVLQATDFYKALSAKKPVHPPIQKTNLLIKNVDYNNCYKLWLYISSFTYLGYTFEIMDKNLPVDSDYYDDLTIIAGLGAQSLVNDNVVKKDNYRDVQFVRPQEKEYNLVTNLSFKPEFDSSKAQAGEEAINEYYFRKMKDELVKLTQENDVVIDKQINVNFSKFYRAIARINDELYNDLIEEQIKADDDSIIRLPIVKKQDEIKRQQERLKRRNLLLKLKWEEVERAQRVQERAQAKLDKLKKELEAEKQKVKDKKVKKGVIRTKTVVKVSRPKKVTLVDNDKKGE